MQIETLCLILTNIIMAKTSIRNIDLDKVRGLKGHEKNWVAISTNNKIAGSGRTVNAAVNKAKKNHDGEFVLVWVPPADTLLALNEAQV